MIVARDGSLRIYVLSVGQADTSVVVSPAGNLVIIDAVSPDKLTDLLTQLGLAAGGRIEELVITHPHSDHYRGAIRLLDIYDIGSVTLSPFWNRYGMVGPSYRILVNRVERRSTPLRFVAGYSRIYLDGATRPTNSSIALDPTQCYLELLGPSNRLIHRLGSANKLDINHLSVMARLRLGTFAMVFAADAQMENWAVWDEEGMLAQRCHVLKSAHHGSGNGTQWERLARMRPKYVLVSSDPDEGHSLPDLVGTAAFARYEMRGKGTPVVALTRDTGTVGITVRPSSSYKVVQYREEPDNRVPFGNARPLTRSTNPTDWKALLHLRTNSLYSP